MPDHAALPILTDAYFKAAQCRNCGDALLTPFCPQCGQKRVGRLGRRSIGAEFWTSFRWFEMALLKGAWQLLRAPGTVAREYVFGARTRHVHPLKLLLAAVGVLLLVLAQSRFLNSTDQHVSRAMELVRSYANWSFSLGIVAIAFASLIAFRRRGGFNATEHLVLAAYTHFLIIAVSIVNLLPTLVWRAPEFIAWHKRHSTLSLGMVEVLIVLVAFRQFFHAHMRRDGWRLALAALLFVASKWALLRLYAWLLVKLVLARLA